MIVCIDAASIFVFSAHVEFDYRDALNLECRLTEDERMMRDQVASYCTEKLMPRVVMANRNECKANIMIKMLMTVFVSVCTCWCKSIPSII